MLRPALGESERRDELRLSHAEDFGGGGEIDLRRSFPLLSRTALPVLGALSRAAGGDAERFDQRLFGDAEDLRGRGEVGSLVLASALRSFTGPLRSALRKAEGRAQRIFGDAEDLRRAGDVEAWRLAFLIRPTPLFRLCRQSERDRADQQHRQSESPSKFPVHGSPFCIVEMNHRGIRR